MKNVCELQVTRRLLHRPLLVYRMPNLLCIDGIPVSNDEKTKAELYFIEQQVAIFFFVSFSPRQHSFYQTFLTYVLGVLVISQPFFVHN